MKSASLLTFHSPRSSPASAEAPPYPLWHALVIPWLFLAVLFWPILLGKAPVNIDWLANSFPPWCTGLHRVNPDIDDPILQHYPLAYRAAKSWQTGLVPLWNPDIACGMPLLADSHSMPFDPVYIIAYMTFSLPHMAWSMLICLQFFLLAFMTSGFLRCMGCNRAGASMGSIALVFSGTVITWCQMRLYTGTLIWLMAALWSIESNTHRQNRSIIDNRTAIAMMFMAFSGHLQFIFYGWIIVTMYAFVRYGKSMQSIIKSATLPVWSAVLSLTLWLPQLELISRTMRGDPGRYFPAFRFGLAPWISLVCPDFFGHPVTGNYFGGYLFNKSYLNLPILYIGLIPLFFTVFAILSWRKNTRFFIVITALILIGLTLLYLKPVRYGLYTAWPGFFSLDPGRLAAMAVPMLSILSGIGLTLFLNLHASSPRSLRKLFATPIALCILTLLLSCCVYIFKSKLLAQMKPNSITAYLLKLHADNGLLLLFPPVMKTLGFSLIFCFLILVYMRNRLTGFFPIVLGISLLALDLMPPASIYNSFLSDSYLKLSPPLRDRWPATNPEKGRICSIDPVMTTENAGKLLPPNTSLLLNGYDFRGYVSTYVGRYAELLNAIQKRRYFDRRLQTVVPPLFDASGIRYFMTDGKAHSDHWKPMIIQPEWTLFENPDFYPKAWLIENTLPFHNLDDMLQKVKSGNISLDRTVFIEGNRNYRHFQSMTFDMNGAYLQTIRTDPHTLVFDVETTNGGFMVVNDVFYPGWKVLANDEPAELLSADYLFRGTLLPAGKLTVKMFYRPISFLLGLFCTLTGILISAAGTVLGRKHV
ncbi:hypothetical protein JW979_03095 [bacterium]|nr:hypothetical protein [candidate division CSSED10-310 bacterium]